MSCAFSPIYENQSCFHVKKSILYIELVAKDDYYISIRRPGWKGALLSGLVPHKELEKTIKKEKWQPVSCQILRNEL